VSATTSTVTGKEPAVSGTAVRAGDVRAMKSTVHSRHLDEKSKGRLSSI
jgi:hypothetical protein